jgi:hypothetical protein
MQWLTKFVLLAVAILLVVCDKSTGKFTVYRSSTDDSETLLDIDSKE